MLIVCEDTISVVVDHNIIPKGVGNSSSTIQESLEVGITAMNSFVDSSQGNAVSGIMTASTNVLSEVNEVLKMMNSVKAGLENYIVTAKRIDSTAYLQAGGDANEMQM